MARRKARTRADRPAVVINGWRLNPRQQGVWRAANDDLESGEAYRVRRGLTAVAALETELGAAREDAAVSEGVNDTLRLERLRGEHVERSGRDEGGRCRVRIRTRDGLETLERSGAISPTQYRAGLLYRDLYEAADPERDLQSHMRDLNHRGGSTSMSPRAEALAQRRVRLAAKVAAIEAQVRCADRNDHAVRALREIAGHARCVSHFVRGGGAQARYRQALILALEICVEYFRLA